MATRIENYRKVFVEGAARSKFPSIRNHSDGQAQANIARMLRVTLSADETAMPLKELLESKRNLLDEALSADVDTADVFGRVNVAWVFAEVALSVDYPIFIAEARQVGYKRTKRGERPQPNDLFDLEAAPERIDTGEVRQAYEDEAMALERDVVVWEARFKVLDQGGKAAEKSRAEERIEAARGKAIAIRSELVRVLAEIERCYDAHGRLLDAHRARDDKALLAVFGLPRMTRWRSEAILVRADRHRTLLDLMRKEQLWS